MRAPSPARRPSARRLCALPALLAAAVVGTASGGAAAQPAAPPPFTLPPLPRDDWPAGPFVVERVVFEGATVLGAAELDAIAAPFMRRPIRLADVEELRQRVTRAYVERGYVSSGAVVPVDAWRGDGTLRLRIVEGVVAEVRTKGMQRLADAYAASRLVRRGEPLDTGVLQERFRALLADPLFERINARLLPGEAAGTSVLDLDVVRARPYSLAVFAHNHLAPAVGSAVAGIDGSVRNLTGWGDTLAATVSRSRGSTNVDVGFTLPIAARTTYASVRWARGASSVVEEPLAALDIEGTVQTREVTLGHPFVDEPRRKLTLGASWSERRNRTTYLAGLPFELVTGQPRGDPSEVEAWRFFQDLALRFDRHAVALRSTFVFGRSNQPTVAELERQPPRDYRFWIGQAQGAFALGDGGAQLVARATVQLSDDNLVPLEQLAVGGRHTVRGYRENQLVRDTGHAVSIEVHHPLLAGDDARRRVVLVPFVDAGSAKNRGGPRADLASFGLGLAWTWDSIEGEVFAAKRLHRRLTPTHGDLQDHGIHLMLRWRPL